MSQQPDDYEKLRALWYKKLEASGFEDIEQSDGNLKVWAGKFKSRRFQELMVNNEHYYQLVNQFLNDYQFASTRDKIIWTYHAEGLSVRDIATTLNKIKATKTNRQTVWVIIKRLEGAMKKMYVSDYSGANE